jgi:hypothetical protein
MCSRQNWSYHVRDYSIHCEVMSIGASVSVGPAASTDSGKKFFFHREVGGTRFLQNVGTYPRHVSEGSNSHTCFDPKLEKMKTFRQHFHLLLRLMRFPLF